MSEPFCLNRRSAKVCFWPKAAICEHQLSAISPSVVDDSCAEYLAQQPGRGLNVEHCETDMIYSPYSAEHRDFPPHGRARKEEISGFNAGAHSSVTQ